MKYCSSCGNECSDADAFCNICGAKFGFGGAQSEKSSGSRETGPEEKTKGQTFKDRVADAFTNPVDRTAEFTEADISSNRIYAVLAYIGPLFFVGLLAAPDSKFARFHSNQGLVLLIAEFAVSLLYIIPFAGWLAGSVLEVLLGVLAVIGIISAAQGKAKELPVTGKYKIIN